MINDVDIFLDDLLQNKITPTSTIEFTQFKRQMWSGYEHTPFHAVIDQHLKSVYQYLQTGDGISRLMIFMPPRYGKTQSVSRHFPAWLLGRDPSLEIILTSYGARLAQKNSRAVRNIINRSDYQVIFPNTNLATDKKAADEWRLEDKGGGMVAAGVGGGITGFGGRVIIIDDPFRNRADAESDTIRQRVKDWYTDDLYTRLEDLNPSAIIIINTRWHHDDLSGFLLSDNVDDWTVISFPALATEDDDILGRSIGEPLWERKHSIADLALKEKQMGTYSFESLFQQNPQQTKGKLFDTALIEVLDSPPPVKRAVRFYDLAVTKKSRASYTVGLKLGQMYDGRFCILDVYRVQAEMPDVHQSIIQNAKIDGNEVPIVIETEKGGIVELQYLHREEGLNSHTMTLQPPKGDKYTRATPVASKMDAGRIAMVKAVWNRAFVDELAMFPSGQWDDQIDALSGAYKELDDSYDDGSGTDFGNVLANYRGLTSE